MSLRVASGYIVHQTKTLAFMNGLTINDSPQTFAVPGHFGGNQDQRQSDSRHTISGTLDGRLLDVLSVIFAYNAISRGAPITADNTLVVHCSDGVNYSYRNAALTGIGTINLSSKAIASVELTFTCLHGSGYAVGDADGMVTRSTGNSFTFPTIDPALMLSEAYTAAWGASSPWDSFALLEGASLNFTIDTFDVPSQTKGTQELRLRDFKASVTFKPDAAAITDAAILAKMNSHGSGARIGGSLRSADVFTLTSPTLLWTLNNPFISQHSQRLTFDQLAEQGITLESTLASAGGPAFTVVDNT